MNKNKWIMGAIVSIFLCTIGITLGQHNAPQNPITTKSTGKTMNPIRLSPEYYAKLAKSYHFMQVAQADMDAGQYVKAEADARKCISFGRYSNVGQEILAASLNAQGKTHEAFLAYKEIADAGGYYPRNELPYALLLLKKGDWEDAVTEYNKQLSSVPNGDVLRENSDFTVDNPQPEELEAAIHVGLGLSTDWLGYSRTKNCDQVLVQFHQAVVVDPGSPVANYYYGKELQNENHFAEARTWFQKAVDLSGSSVSSASVKVAAEKEIRN